MWEDDLSVRDLITFPRAESDLFIYPASFNRSPEAWVSLVRSEPARSTMWKVELFITQMPFSNVLLSMKVERTECDLELYWFIAVDPTWRFSVPYSINFTTLSYDEISLWVIPRI
jgi:hypothetical protein